MASVAWYESLVGMTMSSGGVIGVLSAFVLNVSYKLRLPNGKATVVTAQDAMKAKRMQLDGIELEYGAGRTCKVCALDGLDMHTAEYSEPGVFKVRWTHDGAAGTEAEVPIETILRLEPDLLVGVQFYKTYDNDELFLLTVAPTPLRNGEKCYRLNFDDGDYDFITKLALLQELSSDRPMERVIRCEDVGKYSAMATPRSVPVSSDGVTTVKFWGRSIYVALGQKGPHVIVNDLLSTDDGQPGEAKASEAIARQDILVAINGVSVSGQAVEDVARKINTFSRPITLSFVKPKPRVKRSALLAPLGTPKTQPPTVSVTSVTPNTSTSAASKPPKASTPIVPAASATPKASTPIVSADSKPPKVSSTAAVPASPATPRTSTPIVPGRSVVPAARKAAPATIGGASKDSSASEAVVEDVSISDFSDSMDASDSSDDAVVTKSAGKILIRQSRKRKPALALQAAAPLSMQPSPKALLPAPTSAKELSSRQPSPKESAPKTSSPKEPTPKDASPKVPAPTLPLSLPLSKLPSSSPKAPASTAVSPETPASEVSSPEVNPSKARDASTPIAVPPEKAVDKGIVNPLVNPPAVASKRKSDEEASTTGREGGPEPAKKRRPSKPKVKEHSFLSPVKPSKLKAKAKVALQPSAKKLELTTALPPASVEAPTWAETKDARARRPKRIELYVSAPSLLVSLANVHASKFPVVTGFTAGHEPGEIELDGRVRPGAQLLAVNNQSLLHVPAHEAAERLRAAGRPVTLSFANSELSFAGDDTP
ncbi:hypothetical protein ACHHYP_07199 [Achlya hypogyna]|uniref:PDZ domain-containing protein n=1 Tax=Achlya hypogyna TaxID=1202772 RepID=A0A1V9ZMP5_ACHHY|nr:hypothetical protein ACHHYP_07199 [Achlya hypogyna]